MRNFRIYALFVIVILFAILVVHYYSSQTGYIVEDVADNDGNVAQTDFLASSGESNSDIQKLLSTSSTNGRVFDYFVNIPNEQELVQTNSPENYLIHLNNEDVLLPVGFSPTTDSLPGDKRIPVLVQFNVIPSNEQKAELKKYEIHWDYAISTNTYLAWLIGSEMHELVKNPLIRSMSPILMQWKYSPSVFTAIKTSDFDGYVKNKDGNPFFAIYFSPTVSLEEAEEMLGANGIDVDSVVQSMNVVFAAIPIDKLDEIATELRVLAIEQAYHLLAPGNDGSRAAIGAEPLQVAPYNLDGVGIKMLIYDAGSVSSHVDLAGRIIYGEIGGPPSHATHVAGTAAGSGIGSSNRIYRGIATRANVVSYVYEGCRPNCQYNNPQDIEQNFRDAVTIHGAHLATASLAANIPYNGYPCAWLGDYEVTSRLIDSIVYGIAGPQVNNLLSIWIAGNERGPAVCGAIYSTLTVPGGTAKNALSIGAIYSDDLRMTSFSSWGPTDDGRLKPDVVAAGCEWGNDLGITSTVSTSSYMVLCGTSMAAPAVAGTAALMLQAYRDRYWSQTYPFTAASLSGATVKGVLMHTARDLGNPGPDYQHGYGLVDAKAAVDVLRDPRGCFVEQQIDSTSVPYEMIINTPLGSHEGLLKATLVWSDPPAVPLAARTLINDLDLRVSDVTGRTYLPLVLDPANPANNAVPGNNNLDNVEQMQVRTTTTGAWTVRVSPTAVLQGPQSYSLVVTWDSPSTSIPSVFTLGGPVKIGNLGFGIGVSDSSSPNAPFILVIYALRGAIPLSDGRIIPVDVSGPFIVMQGTLDANGRAVAPVPIPDQPSLAGITVHAVALTLDPTRSGQSSYIKGISCQKSVSILP